MDYAVRRITMSEGYSKREQHAVAQNQQDSCRCRVTRAEDGVSGREHEYGGPEQDEIAPREEGPAGEIGGPV